MDIGKQRHDPVNTIDVFPTVVHLATGVELEHNAIVDASNLTVSGRSLLGNRENVYTFSQYPRCQLVSTAQGWKCITSSGNCDRRESLYIGYMVRTVEKKYVEWRPFQDKFTQCAKPMWPKQTSAITKRLKKMWQIDAAETHTLWNESPAVQRELFDDYRNTQPIKWSNWEFENVLVHKRHADVLLALEMSAAIRWRFDPEFTERGVAEEPCSGHGKVRLRFPQRWNGYLTQPARGDVKCECLQGWYGEECELEG